MPKQPTPPDTIPNYICDGLDKQDPATLDEIADYAAALAEHKRTAQRRQSESEAIDEFDPTPDEWDDDEWDEKIDDARETADIPPSKGTLTTKTIDGREYYYLQWREGGKIRSQYVAPVVPANG
jgi:hypothetical protein